jgi:hypothetical protein
MKNKIIRKGIEIYEKVTKHNDVHLTLPRCRRALHAQLQQQ